MSTNSRVTIDQLVFRNLYYRYQSFVVPLVTVFVCLLLFWLVVIPQAESWLQMRDSLTVDVQNVATLHQNLSLISKFQDAQLDQLLATATNALPAEKDFAGIIDSIQTAANVSGAILGDYSFQLGDLSGVDSTGKLSQQLVQLNIVLKGDMTSAQHFVAQLQKQLPLSDAISLSVGNNSSITVTVVFYYATLPKIVFQDTRPLPILSNVDIQLLNGLASGSNLQNITLVSPSSSPTATLSVTPAISPTPIASATATPSPIASQSAQ